MTATISSWGNSQGLRFPKNVMEALHLSVGDKVNITVIDHKIVLEPLTPTRKKYDIKELVKQFTNGYHPFEAFENQAGLEAW